MADESKKLRRKLQKVFRSMRYRCYNENNRVYKYYGGKGVTICDEWLQSFDNFYNWALLNGYKEGLSIDRIDVNGSYSPKNCRWATMEEQSRNRTNTVLVEYNGKKMTLREWSEELNISLSTISKRKHNGYSDKEIIEGRPKRKRVANIYLQYNGKTLSIREWSKELNTKEGTIRTRLDRGWSIEESLFGRGNNKNE